MTATLIPFRTLWYNVPANRVLEVLSVLLDREIRYKITNVSADNSFMKLYACVNLSNSYQRNAIPAIEKIVQVQ